MRAWCAAAGDVPKKAVRTSDRLKLVGKAYKLSKLRISACEYEAPKTFLSPGRLASRLLLDDEVRQKGEPDLLEHDQNSWNDDEVGYKHTRTCLTHTGITVSSRESSCGESTTGSAEETNRPEPFPEHEWSALV